MRLLLFAFLSVAMVSCGGDKSSSSNNGRQNQDSRPTQSQESEPYSTVYQPADIMDAAIDVPVEVSGDKITFKKSVSNAMSGLRSTCGIAVQEGESFSYRLTGSGLQITTSTGESYTLANLEWQCGRGSDARSAAPCFRGRESSDHALSLRRIVQDT
jgi:hypothetical protein